MLEDEFLPTYDVSDAVATVVDADAATAWAALMAVDLIELGRRRPLVGVLGALRVMPEVVGHLLHGEPPAAPPKHMRLRDTAAIPARAGGWAKTVYALSARPLGDRQGTLLSGVMRTATTDEHARRWFRRYWTFGVGSGAHVLVTGLLEAARDDAERTWTGV
jgi:hypothetical protein